MACVQLGYQRAGKFIELCMLSMREQDHGTLHTIIRSYLRCVGTENRLVDCQHNGIGIDNCAHSEDAGLRCAGIKCDYRNLHNISVIVVALNLAHSRWMYKR